MGIGVAISILFQALQVSHRGCLPRSQGHRQVMYIVPEHLQRHIVRMVTTATLVTWDQTLGRKVWEIGWDGSVLS